MLTRFSEKFIAYLALISGLLITVVAEYYSILGLTAIFSAAVIPVIIMGIVLGVGKIIATLWLKQNWNIAPIAVKIYLIVAIIVLMLITSMGIFGFLSKAHSDQSLISGDSAAKIALYDQKIETERQNIETFKEYLKQLDGAVIGVLSAGDQEIKLRDGTTRIKSAAERSIQIRKSQAEERARTIQNIEEAQSLIVLFQEESAPLRAENRKIEAEVGPIKYIAAFVYSDTDISILEKTVTWVIVILIFVFDPLAVVLLLASQYSFQNIRQRYYENKITDPVEESKVEEPNIESTEGDSPRGTTEVIDSDLPTVTEPKKYAYLNKGFAYPEGWTFESPLVYKPEVEPTTSTYQIFPELQKELDKEEPLFVQNEEQSTSSLWSKTLNLNQPDYFNISQEKLNEEIEKYADLVRTKKIKMSDVPETILLAVRSKV